jgi:hypothetical protein
MTLLWLCVLMGVAAGILGGWWSLLYTSGIAILQITYIAWRDRA